MRSALPEGHADLTRSEHRILCHLLLGHSSEEIAQIHGAMKAGRLTCRGLVEQYLRRIDSFDKNGPAINAIVAGCD